jgi:hypothetical protein
MFMSYIWGCLHIHYLTVYDNVYVCLYECWLLVAIKAASGYISSKCALDVPVLQCVVC